MPTLKNKNDPPAKIYIGKDEALLTQCADMLLSRPNFKSLNLDDMRFVLKLGYIMDIDEGYLLLADGSQGKDMYILMHGELSVLSAGQHIVDLNTPGDVVGEMALLVNRPRSADVLCKSPSRVICLPEESFIGPNVSASLSYQFITIISRILVLRLEETTKRSRNYEDALRQIESISSSKKQVEDEFYLKLHQATLYSQVIHNSPIAVIVTDDRGEIAQYNPAAMQIFKDLLPDTIIPTNLAQIIEPLSTGNFSLSINDIWQGEWTRYNTSYSVIAIPIVDRNNKKTISFQLTDISLKKQHSVILKQKNEEIARALKDLEYTYKELQNSDRIKTDTLSAISDEILLPTQRLLIDADQLKIAYANAGASLAANIDAASQIKTLIKNIKNNSSSIRDVVSYIDPLLEVQQQLQSKQLSQVKLYTLLAENFKNRQHLLDKQGIKLVVTHSIKTERPIYAYLNHLKLISKLVADIVCDDATGDSRITLHRKYIKQSVTITITYKPKPPADYGVLQFGKVVGIPLARRIISEFQGHLEDSRYGAYAKWIIKLPLEYKKDLEIPHQLLIFDQDEDNAHHTERLIKSIWTDATVNICTNPFECLTEYEKLRPDLIVIDPSIKSNSWSNHRLIAYLTENRQHISPILCVSALYANPHERIIAIERGANDFVTKPYTERELRFKITQFVEAFRRESRLSRNIHQVQKQALTDQLTGLANRKHLDQFIETQIIYCNHTDKPCSLIFIDIDNFKLFNDTHGHLKGDIVLKRVSDVFRTSVRSVDLAARYGGEEFAIVLPETTKEMAYVVAEKIRRNVEALESAEAKTQPLGRLSISAGVAAFPEDAKTPEELIQASDRLLYEAKLAGRNRTIVSQTAS